MLEDFQMGSFHTIVLVVAFVILIIILGVVGFGIKNTSKAVAFPPVPSACPDGWTSGADASGNPTCGISDPSGNMPQIVAIGTKSVYSANGIQWSKMKTETKEATSIAHVIGNTWFYIASSGVKVATITNDGEITDITPDISGTPLSVINGVVRISDDATALTSATTVMLYVYGKNSDKLAIQPITYTISSKKITYETIISSNDNGSVVGMAYKDINTILAITDTNVYSIMKSGSTWTWTSRGPVPNITLKCIVFADNRFFVGGTGTGTDTVKPVISSTAGYIPTSGNISWRTRATTSNIDGTVVGLIYNTDAKLLIAISDETTANKKTLITSTNGTSWTSHSDVFVGGKALGFRKNKTTTEMNVGLGTMNAVGNVTWENAYTLKLGTSTICEQRNWASNNRVSWDGVSNYNSC
jgi:hypothetical protein